MKSILELVGKTPLIDIPHSRRQDVRIMAKLEWYNPSGSIKDRVAKAIFEAAIKTGMLVNKILLDASNGNTGISFAMLGAYHRIPVALVVPDSISEEKKRLLRNYGAKLHFTQADAGIDGARELAQRIAHAKPDTYFFADQHNNEETWRCHYTGTAPEIWDQTDREVTHFVAGLGTTGTFTGTARYLKKKGVTCVSVEPDDADHGLDGWKHLASSAAPGIYDEGLADVKTAVSTELSYQYCVAASHHLGLMISPSAAANLASCIAIAEQLDQGNIVTVFPDAAGKYLSLPFWTDRRYHKESPF